jgi:small subunit ribosomal protein S16
MIKLRLKKYGRKGQPCYRIVAMNSKTKRDGSSIEELGFYNPMTDETHLKFQKIIARLKVLSQQKRCEIFLYVQKSLNNFKIRNYFVLAIL